jgi:hypothetical protein
MKRKIFLCGFIFLYSFSINYSQEIDLTNLEFKFIDDQTFKDNVIYGFKDINDKSYYFISPSEKITFDHNFKPLNVGETYNLTVITLPKSIKLERDKEYIRIPSITYFDIFIDGNKVGEEVFEYKDSIMVDLFYSPNLISHYYIKIE